MLSWCCSSLQQSQQPSFRSFFAYILPPNHECIS
jgi:hypothetical protein